MAVVGTEAFEELDEHVTHGRITGEAVALDLHATGFALRAAGTIIDVLLSWIAFALLVAGLNWLAAQSGAEDAVYTIIAISSLVLCLVVLPTAVETLTRGKSLGRLAVGARIVRDDGGAIGFRHAAIRALVGVLELYITFGGIAAIVGLLSSRSKRLGDLLAGTYALNERAAAAPTAVFGVPVELVAWASVADVARMPDQLARRIAQFLSNAHRLAADRRPYVARTLAAEAAAFVSPVPDAEPELFLAALSVVRREREARALQLESERLNRLQPALRGRPHGFPERG